MQNTTGCEFIAVFLLFLPFIGERAKHSLGVLNANLRYTYIYIIYGEVHTSPLSVAWAPHYIKEAELGHSHWWHGQS